MFLRKDDRNLADLYISVLREEVEAQKPEEFDKKPDSFEDKISDIKRIEISEEEAEKIRIKILRAKTILRSKMPGLSYILDNMKTVLVKDDPRLKTMAVDNFRNIYIDINFLMNQLSVQTTAGVLAHEAAHIANYTFKRRRGRNSLLWNYATDYAMNLAILTAGMELPPMGLIPEKINGKYHIINKELGWNIDIDDLTAEEIYIELYKLLGDPPQSPTPPPPPPPPRPPQGRQIDVGDVIYHRGSKIYGIVKDVDYKLDELDFDPITKEEALKLAKEQSKEIIFK